MRQKITIKYYDQPGKETSCDKIDIESGYFILINEDPAKLRFINMKDVKSLTAEDHPVRNSIVN